MSNLSSTIKSIQDIMRQDSGVDGDAQRLSQLTWLLFLKVFDALEEELEFTQDNYQSPIPAGMRWRDWAADEEGMTGEALLSFVDNELLPTLAQLPGSIEQNPRAYVLRSVFDDTYNYMKSGHLLRQVINKLAVIDFNRQAERHQFNDLYEKLLKDLQAAGNAGEFYTPRAVTQFMTDITNPQLGETVMDPATGTGGFLVCAIEQLRKQAQTPEQQALLQTAVRGVEKKPLPHSLCVTNLMLHGIEVPSQIKNDNTVSRPLRDYGKADQVDIILTNPPFGGTEEPGIEDGFPADLRNRETADLFMILIMKLLKDGGRAAVVLPDGFLFGEGSKSRIKEKLLNECNLHTIVRLPNGVFNPYTGIKTNLLFFTKGQPTEHVWYYEHRYPQGVKNYNKTKPIRIEEFDVEKAWWGNAADGFASRVENEQAWKVNYGEKIADAKERATPHWEDAKKLRSLSVRLKADASDVKLQLDELKENGKEITESFAELKQQHQSLAEESRKAAQASNMAQQAGDAIYWPTFNLDQKNPHAAEQVSHDPDELLAAYSQLQAKAQDLRNQLQAMLAQSLAGDADSTETEKN